MMIGMKKLLRLLCKLGAVMLLAMHGIAAADERPLAQPRLVRQVTATELLKSDWNKSAFDQSGELLLVVANDRAFIVITRTGRVLRDVALPNRELLVAAIADAGGHGWLGFTSEARLVRISPETGLATPRMDLGEAARKNVYERPRAAFAYDASGALLTLVQINREILNARNKEQSLLLLENDSENPVLEARIDPQGTAPSEGVLTINRRQNLAAIYDPKNAMADILFWSLPTAAQTPQRGIHQLCSVAYRKLTASMQPLDEGFVVFNRDGSATYLSAPDAGVCNDPTNPPVTENEPATCNWQIVEPDVGVISAFAGNRPDQFIIVDLGLRAYEVTLERNRCAFTKRLLLDLTPFDTISRMTKRIGTSPNARTDPDEYAAKYLERDGSLAFIAGGGLVIAQPGQQPVLVGDLAGDPTGAWEMDLEGDLILSTLPLSPLKLFDLGASSGASIDYDVFTRLERIFFYQRPYALIRDMRVAAVMTLDGMVRYYTPERGAGRLKPPDQALDVIDPIGLCASVDGKRLWVTDLDGAVHSFAREDPLQPLAKVGQIETKARGVLYKLGCDPKGQLAIIGGSIDDDIFIFESGSRGVKLLQRLKLEGTSSDRARPSIAADGLNFALGSHIFSRATKKHHFKLDLEVEGSTRILFDATVSQALIVGNSARIVPLRRTRDGKLHLEPPLYSFGAVPSGGWLSDGRILLQREPNDFEIWRPGQPTAIGSFAFAPENSWLFIAPDSRFDTNRVEATRAGHWLMPDDPLRTYPAEIFMRDYFEPQLLARLSACSAKKAEDPGACDAAFSDIRPLASLNRVQPGVRIVSVMPRGGEHATIEIEVTPGEDQTQPNDRKKTGVYDLRLFRDGQLVHRLPDRETDANNIETWRAEHLVRIPAGEKGLRISFEVALPTLPDSRSVSFSAYAFNEDRVISNLATAPPFKVPADAKPRARKAYFIAIGVNGYDAPSRNLSFAVNDAEMMAGTAARFAGYENVPVILASDAGGPRRDATTAAIRAVLQRLAGAEIDDALLAHIPGADRLAKATPDDMIVISFSGHGHTDKNGGFYLLPSDSGASPIIDENSLKKFISSEMLGTWLRPIDAGQMALIIDACHSAASVEQLGFKPGPMGDRGFGQLAYDKAMRILAASQANDVALEINTLSQGLLTYALTHDGLGAGGGVAGADINKDKMIWLGEWLQYGAERTPVLYEEMRQNRLAYRYVGIDLEFQGRDPSVDPRFASMIERRAQTPSLFDFARPGTDAVIGISLVAPRR
ncbi:putative protein containing caspase domain protein [Novosphingobium resinovorum]|uniref:Peptidase C14 caspase domain-containing protein n=1 Tax=Novosphingobium resinovorum TaxID=158500 RepID=A0A031JZD8_9SPHN|nr:MULTISPECIES: caspase family protein [Novosphingobium]EZP83111.1 putative protein containing caspase domain protein [Novosphingobium resinovorum]